MNYFRHLMNVISEAFAVPEDDFTDANDQSATDETSTEDSEEVSDDDTLEEATSQFIVSREQALDKTKEARKLKSLSQKDEPKQKPN